MVYISLFGIKTLFMSRTSVQYLLVDQMSLPLLVFQAAFLALIGNLVLPVFFKFYGGFIFGTYTM